MNKSIVLGIGVEFYGRLWPGELVGCGCACRMVGYPKVANTVHFRLASLCYCFVLAAVGHDLFMDFSSKGVM